MKIRLINNWRSWRSFGFKLFTIDICVWPWREFKKDIYLTGGFIDVVIFGFGINIVFNHESHVKQLAK